MKPGARKQAENLTPYISLVLIYHWFVKHHCLDHVCIVNAELQVTLQYIPFGSS
jgi:hypothetical protein